MTSNIRGADAFKAIFYFPSLFTGAAAAILWVNMFNKEYGIVNRLLSFVNIAPVNWLDTDHAFLTVVLMNFFWIGGATIIYYAGMKQIPRSLYEAAEIDGAGAFRRFHCLRFGHFTQVGIRPAQYTFQSADAARLRVELRLKRQPQCVLLQRVAQPRLPAPGAAAAPRQLVEPVSDEKEGAEPADHELLSRRDDGVEAPPCAAVD